MSERTIEVDPDSDYAKKMLSEEEREELKKQEGNQKQEQEDTLDRMKKRSQVTGKDYWGEIAEEELAQEKSETEPQHTEQEYGSEEGQEYNEPRIIKAGSDEEELQYLLQNPEEAAFTGEIEVTKDTGDIVVARLYDYDEENN
jgi:hypothetical protein